MENAIEQAKQYASAGIEKATELGQQAIDLVKEQLSEVTNATTSTSTTTAKAPGLRRKESSGPLSPAEEKKLEDALANRPTPKELQEKNILKGTSAAPSLQARQEELRQQQIKDSLDGKIAARPTPDELTQRNILKEEPTSNKDGGVQAGVKALEKSMTESSLETEIASRPTPETLIKEGILNKDENPKVA